MPSPACRRARKSSNPWTIWHLALLLPWIVALVPTRLPFRDNSYLWHVRLGDLQAAEGVVTTVDPFSFTAEGASWRSQSWLADLLYSRLDALVGLEGAGWLTAGVGLLTFAVLAVLIYRISGSLVVTSALSVTTAVLFTVFLGPRPAIFSFLLFGLLILVSNDRRLLWASPLILWVWASVHASFPIGLLYLALKLVTAGYRRSGIASLVASSTVCLLTAHGVGVIGFLAQFASEREGLNYLSEWRVPDVLEPPYFTLVIGIFVLLVVASQGQLQKGDWWMIVPFVLILFSTRRSVPVAWIALLPIMARMELPDLPRRELGRVPSVVLAGLVLALPWFVPEVNRVDPERFPVSAAPALSAERVFHDDVVGGWLIYTQWPERQVYIDDRSEVYGAVGFRRLAEIQRGSPEWRDEFERYGITEALVRRDSAIAENLLDAAWAVSHADDSFMVLRSGT